MRQSEIRDKCRYVCQIDGERTIMKAIRHGKGWLFRCECRHRFMSLTARRLWRPADGLEHCGNSSVQDFSCNEQRTWWDGEDLALPMVEWIDDAAINQSSKSLSITVTMHAPAVEESERFLLTPAGC